MHKLSALSCLVVVMNSLILHMSFRVTTLANGQSHGCPSGIEATLKNIDKLSIFFRVASMPLGQPCDCPFAKWHWSNPEEYRQIVYILQGCFNATWTTVWLPICQCNVSYQFTVTDNISITNIKTLSTCFMGYTLCCWTCHMYLSLSCRWEQNGQGWGLSLWYCSLLSTFIILGPKFFLVLSILMGFLSLNFHWN